MIGVTASPLSVFQNNIDIHIQFLQTFVLLDGDIKCPTENNGDDDDDNDDDDDDDDDEGNLTVEPVSAQGDIV